MVKAHHPKRQESKQDSEKLARKRALDVKSQIERLRRELSELPLGDASSKIEIRGTLATEALSDLAWEITRLANDGSLSADERLDGLRRIQQMASDAADELEPKIPTKAPKLWNDRDDPDANPFVWAHETYGRAAGIMVVSDYAKLDRPLGNRLDKDRRANKPIPEGFCIQSKAEREEELRRNPLTWGQLISKLSPDMQRKFRAYKTAEGRRHRMK